MAPSAAIPPSTALKVSAMPEAMPEASSFARNTRVTPWLIQPRGALTCVVVVGATVSMLTYPVWWMLSVPPSFAQKRTMWWPAPETSNVAGLATSCWSWPSSL